MSPPAVTGSAVTEGTQERAVERGQNVPGCLVRCCSRIVKRCRHECGEHAGSYFEVVGRKRCVVGSDLRVAECSGATVVDDLTHAEVLDGLGVVLPREESLRGAGVAVG